VTIEEVMERIEALEAGCVDLIAYFSGQIPPNLMRPPDDVTPHSQVSPSHMMGGRLSLPSPPTRPHQRSESSRLPI